MSICDSMDCCTRVHSTHFQTCEWLKTHFPECQHTCSTLNINRTLVHRYLQIDKNLKSPKLCKLSTRVFCSGLLGVFFAIFYSVKILLFLSWFQTSLLVIAQPSKGRVCWYQNKPLFSVCGKDILSFKMSIVHQSPGTLFCMCSYNPKAWKAMAFIQHLFSRWCSDIFFLVFCKKKKS